MLLKHFTVPALLLLSLALTVRLKADPTYRETQQAAAQTAAAHTFRVFIRGAEAGTEEVTLMEAADGWTLRGSGRLRPPINLSIDYWEARYNRQWRPIELTVNLTENNTQWTVRTTFSGTVASTDVGRGGRPERITHTVAVDSLVLPNLVFGSYEALAARLPSATVGSQLQAYIVPQNVVPVAVNGVSDETIQLPGRMIAARRWKLSFGGPAGALDVEVWTEGSRLLRVDIPSQMLSVLRDDIASVSARLLTMVRANDEQVSIPANGFSLATTISKPAGEGDPQKGHPNAHPTAQSPRGGGPGAGAAVGAPAPPAPLTRGSAAMRFPAVVLVSGSGPSDRDEIVAGVPIFAQLATSLADAGFFVVRYDERGNGQSGGRPESATYEDFASDVRAVVTYLSKRRDVDPRKISVIGYGEGGWIALLAGAKENRVATITLIGTPSISGTELVLEQQRQLFERSGTTAGAQQAAVEQQKRILQAVITGKGWDMLTPDMRRRVDTPLYRSFLMFDPAQALSRVRQPMLIVQPALDREVPPYHGEQLAQLARSRIRARGTDFVQLAGLNHLLTRATTGEVIEYGTLAERSVSPAAVLEISSWLKKTLTAVPAK